MTAADKDSSIGQILSASFIPATQSLNLTGAVVVTDQRLTKDASVEQIFRAVFDPATQALKATGGAGGGLSGNIATNQVAFGSATNVISGTDNFTWVDGSQSLVVTGSISVPYPTTPTINIGVGSPFAFGLATGSNQIFNGTVSGDACIRNSNASNQLFIGISSGNAQLAIGNTVIISNVAHRFVTVGANRMPFTDISSNLTGSANYTVNGTGGLTIAQTLTATGGAFSAGASGFNITGTNAACNVGTNFNLGQASTSGGFFTGTVSGDCCIRNSNTSFSVYIGVGNANPQVAVQNTQVLFKVNPSITTSTDPTLVVGTNTNLAQATTAAHFFTDTAVGDTVIRQGDTTKSIRLGVSTGSTASAFDISNTQISANLALSCASSLSVALGGTFIGNLSTAGTLSAGSVLAVGGTADPSAICTIISTTAGLLPPRMTTTQKNAISSPTSGLIVFDTTLNKLCVRGAVAWETITSV